MDIATINKEFAKLINQRGIHNKLGITSDQVRNYRRYLKEGINVSTDLKVELLRKSGWRPEATKFTQLDLVALLKYNGRVSQSARDKGPEYVVEKWLLSRNKG